MKYVIKNCPNLMNSYYSTGEIKSGECGLCTNDKLCKDIIDCLLKQIVDLCQRDVGNKENMFLCARSMLADEIIEKLEIEECEQ